MSIFNALRKSLTGDFFTDVLHRRLYATDASIYQKMPLAVACPANEADISLLIQFARDNRLSLIPRTAGTSLAGQCVGEGIVVDVSKHFTKILEINQEEGWVRVQPGVIRDELNAALKPYGLYFGPNTSTSNRCMMGGMLGNNSCGSTSIRYGTTRHHVLEVETVLSDGSVAIWGEIKSTDQITNSLQKQIVEHTIALLSPADVRQEIEAQYPLAAIHRRNTGYAIDEIVNQKPFNPIGENLNLAKLLAGSEGTLAFTTAIKFHVNQLPPPLEAVVCVHFHDLHACMEATVLAMESEPYQCELMDKIVLDATKSNIEQTENRFFVEGDPAAILCVELRSFDATDLHAQLDALINRLVSAGYGYAFPVIFSPETTKIWNLRAAGLGLLSLVPGDAKPIAFVEDTAVALPELPAYIREFDALMQSYGQQAVYYAHAGAGELHLRPALNLKTPQGRKHLRDIALASAQLVKKYRGSLSGEHGDGRVRAEFIPLMIGEKNYELLREIKKLWDPMGIFNPGKIVDALPMDEDLRYASPSPEINTFLHFGSDGIVREAEKCNGSGDCRKPVSFGATMCPSYQATKNEKDSTRARANALRQILTENNPTPFQNAELKEVLDLCLSCKACIRECPSSVNMAAMKAEFTHQYNQLNGTPLRSKVFGHFHTLAAMAAPVAGLANMFSNFLWMKKWLGIATERKLPKFVTTTGLQLAKSALQDFEKNTGKSLVLCIDEFTNYNDPHIAKAATLLLGKLGYQIKPVYVPSGRAFISKGMLLQARNVAEKALAQLQFALAEGLPIVGLEPSAILGFRDEFPNLVSEPFREAAKQLSGLAQTFEEFIFGEVEDKIINQKLFTQEEKTIHLHLHCHQKSLSHIKYSKAALSLPTNYKIRVIPSGCCGMAGSFGYEAEHYQISMQIGEMVLFPAVRQAAANEVVVASGTSCRHQIVDGTHKKALHPAEVLLHALK